jgi:hypothetical protein
MPNIKVTIEAFVDENFPGFVECSLLDVHGRIWKFLEKVPVVSQEDIWSDSEYPRQGVIACTIVERSSDSSGRPVAKVDTAKPWGIESTEGNTIFEIFADQLEDDEVGV